MAKLSSVIKFEGSVDDVTYVRTKNGYRAYKKPKLAKALSERVVENNGEFKTAAHGGKLLRVAFRNQLQNAKDGELVTRLQKAMMQVVKADATSPRGQRNVMDGETELLKDFQFNARADLKTICFVDYTTSLDRAAGSAVIDVPAMVPTLAIVAPPAGTHYKLVAAFAAIDFENEVFEIEGAESAILPLNSLVQPAVQLQMQLTPASAHPLFLVFGIQFFQQVNGTEYPLKNGIYNPMGIINVSGL